MAQIIIRTSDRAHAATSRKRAGDVLAVLPDGVHAGAKIVLGPWDGPVIDRGFTIIDVPGAIPSLFTALRIHRTKQVPVGGGRTETEPARGMRSGVDVTAFTAKQRDDIVATGRVTLTTQQVAAAVRDRSGD